MDFYTIDYIIAHQSADASMRGIVIIVLLVAALGFSLFYLRDRIRTRWRSVGIGLFVLSLVLLGVQLEQYSMLSMRSSQSERLIEFIQGVADDYGESTDQVLVNSTSLHDGMIVRLDDRNEDYTVDLDDNDNSYTLERTHIIDHDVRVNGGE